LSGNARVVHKESNISLALFVVLAMNVLSYTVVFGVALCAAYILINVRVLARINKTDLSLLGQLSMPLAMMLIVGLVLGLVNHNDTYDMLKDAYFFIKVLIYLTFGYVFFQKNPAIVIVRTFIWFGIAVSILYVLLLIGFIASEMVDVSSVDRYRKSIPDLPYDPLMSIALLLFVMPRTGLLGRNALFISLLQSVAVVSTLSRLSLLILFAVFAMYVKMKLKLSRGLFMLPLMLSVVGVVSIIVIFEPGKHEDSVGGQLLFKISNVFNETLSSDFKDRQAIIENWRAYEALQGVIKFSLGSRTEQLFGHGFGALTDIGFEIKLGGVVRSDIPIFHNGYVFLLVKLGLLGMLLYSLFIYGIYSQMKKFRKKFWKGEFNQLAKGVRITMGVLIFFLIAITAVFFGIFNNAIFNNLVILLVMLLLYYGNTLTRGVEERSMRPSAVRPR